VLDRGSRHLRGGHRLAVDGVRLALERDDVEVKHFIPAPVV
jgi:hypothetical protein